MAGSKVAWGVLFAVATFLSFSTADAFVKWLSAGYSVVQLVFFTALGAMIPVAVLASREGGWRALRPRNTKLVLVRAVFLAADSFFAYFAFRHLPLANAYTVILASPLLITALSGPILGEYPGWRRWIAVAIGFAGVLIVLRPGAAPLEIGYLGAIGAAACFALGLLFTRPLGGTETGACLVFTTFVAKLLFAGLALPGAWTPMPLGDFGVMLLAGTFVGLAQIFVVFAFRHAPAPVVAPFQFTQIIWGVLFGMLFFGDYPDGYVIVGSLVVAASGIYIFLREGRASRDG